MPYSQFTTIGKVKEAFGINTIEGDRFLKEIEPITPCSMLIEFLRESVPLASATGSEKALSEGIIYPILLEVRRILGNKVSLFSGEDFTVDESVGLNGVCDFPISLSPELLEIEAPAVVVVEAKRSDLKTGMGQCVAEMIASQRFNEIKGTPTNTIYVRVTTGILWRFLRLRGQTVEIDLTNYLLEPVEQIIGFFVWMIQNA